MAEKSSSSDIPRVEFDLGEALGAEARKSDQRIVIYLPDRDCNSQIVDNIDAWVEAGMDLLTEINGGVTRLPWADGQWTDGTITIKERTAVIYSYVRDAVHFGSNFKIIKEFLHEFGRETNQGEVFVEYIGEGDDGYISRAYGLTAYDKP